MSCTSNELPTFEHLSKFLDQYGVDWPRTDQAPQTAKAKINTNGPNSTAILFRRFQTTRLSIPTCAVCKGSHQMHQCDRFLAMSAGKRSAFVKEASVCFNCLRPGHITNAIVKGVGNSAPAPARGKVTITLHPRFQDSSIEVDALILSRVTSQLPNLQCTSKQWPHIRNLQLADECYFQPARVDVLLGPDYVGTALSGGKRVGVPNTPIAFNTIFGWVLTGRIASAPAQQVKVNHCQVEEILQRFWQVDWLPSIKHLTNEERACEDHFAKTHRHSQDGRFVLELLLKENIRQLGDSRAAAAKRLSQVERRLASNPALPQQYVAFMDEFIQLGHMELVNEQESASEQQFFLPHCCVLKPSGTSTKLRVVFDGNESTSALLLNDCLPSKTTSSHSCFNFVLTSSS